MKAITKKLLALLCAMTLLLSAAPAAAAEGAVISVSDVQVTAGKNFTVTVTASDLQALAALELQLHYDDTAFTLTSAMAGSMDYKSLDTDTEGEVRLTGFWMRGLSGSATLLTLQFVASSSASGIYAMDLTIGEAMDTSQRTLTIGAKDGAVTVTKAAPVQKTATLYLKTDRSSVLGGEDVSITVYGYTLQGLAAGDFAFSYDSDVFTFKSLERLNSMDTSTDVSSVNAVNPGLAIMTYVSGTSVKTGDLMKLTLTAKEDIAASTAVTLSPANLYDAEQNYITCSAKSITLSVSPKEEEVVPPAVFFSVPETVTAGENFEVSLLVEGKSRLAAADFTVSYDAAVLQCLQVTPHPELPEDVTVVVNPNFKAGTVKFSMICDDGITVDTPLVSLELVSVGKEAAETTLAVSAKDPIDAKYASVRLECRTMELSIAEAPKEIDKIAKIPYNMTLGSNLVVNMMFPKAALDGTDYTAVLTQHKADGTKRVVELPMSAWGSMKSGGVEYHRVSISVAAKEMSDELSLEIRDTEGNVYNEPFSTSVRNYGELAMSTALTKDAPYTIPMVVDMLNYGAAAQTYFNYNTGDLANNTLTAEQAAKATGEVECVSHLRKGANFGGMNLSLEDQILLNVYFSGIKAADLATKYAKVTFTDYRGKTQKITVPGTEFRLKGKVYGVVVDDVVLADAKQLVTVTVYNADGSVYGDADTSIETVVALSGTDPLFSSIMKFATSAKRYLLR